MDNKPEPHMHWHDAKCVHANCDMPALDFRLHQTAPVVAHAVSVVRALRKRHEARGGPLLGEYLRFVSKPLPTCGDGTF